MPTTTTPTEEMPLPTTNCYDPFTIPDNASSFYLDECQAATRRVKTASTFPAIDGAVDRPLVDDWHDLTAHVVGPYFVGSTDEMTDYQDTLTATAAGFLRQFGDGAYRHSTLDALATRRAVLARRSITTGGDAESPQGIVLASPISFDENTEQKTGGVVGVAVRLPSLDPEHSARWLAAVAPQHRRKGLMRGMMAQVMRMDSNPFTVVAARNNTGLCAAITLGMTPESMTGSIIKLRWHPRTWDADDREDTPRY